AWAGHGWPSDVERTVRANPTVDVVYARRLSEGARQWLTAHDLGWVDEQQAANISLPSGFVIWRDPVRTPSAIQTDGRWTRAALTVAEGLFAGVPPAVVVMENATGLSRG